MNFLKLFLIIAFFMVVSLFFIFYSSNLDVVSEEPNNHLLTLYKIGNEIDLAEQYLSKNANYSKAHVKQAERYYDEKKFKEISSLDQRASYNIMNEVSNLRQLVNSSLPIQAKAIGISEGMTHIEDLIQLLEVALIRNDTQLPKSLHLFFSSLIDSIHENYKNSLIWKEKPATSQANASAGTSSNNVTMQERQININSSGSPSNIVSYRSANGLSNNIFEFIDFVTQLRPDIIKEFNMTKIKEEFKILDNAIANKSDIKKVDELIKKLVIK